MAGMENQLDRPEAAEAPPEDQPHQPRASARDVVLGSVVAALFALSVVVAAILAFDVNPAGPVVVVVAAIVAGSFSYRRVRDIALKSAAVGLVVGGVAAILLWPFFDVS
jgi:hypothetical protein